MTLDCESCRCELAALRRGEDAALPRAELDAHLAGCPACQLSERQAGRLLILLDEFSPAPAADGIERLRRELRGASGPTLRPARRLVPLSAAAIAAVAAAAAAFLIGAFSLDGGPERGRRPAPASAGVFTEGTGLENIGPGPAPVPGQPLAAGARLRVAEGGRACLVLHRGARLELSGGSSFEIVGEDAIRLECGQVLAMVSKGGTPFRVLTAGAEVVTLGTRFAVLVKEGVTSVAVIEGRVRFSGTAAGGGSVEVAAGQCSSLAAGGAPAEPRSAAPDELARALFREPARLELSLVPERSRLRPAERAVARLRLINRGAAAVTVDGVGLSRPGYYIRAEDPSGRRSHFAPAVLSARVDGERTEAPQVRLRPGGRLEMEVLLGEPVSPGEHSFTAVYLESAASATTEWSGARESAPARILVEAPPVPGAAVSPKGEGE